MKRLAIVLVAGCGFSASSSTPSDGTSDVAAEAAIDATPTDGPPGAARKKRITIPDAKIFASLADFPVWLVIDDAAGLGAQAAANGDDIFFTRTDGTPLEWERVAWTKATGHLEAWVRVSLVDGSANEIDLRYGDPGPAHAPNAPSVWQSGFRAVWHMDDALTTTQVRDARNAVNGTAVGGPTSAIGKLGKAIDLDGTNDEITFTNPIAQNTSSTISAWVALAAPTAGFSSVMTVGSPEAYESRWFHTKYTGLAYGFRGDDVMTNTDVHNGQFTLLHWVYDGATKQASLWRDGAQVGATVTVAGTPDTKGAGGHIGNAPVQWGPGGNTTNFANGRVDEVRISSEPRTAGWIRTEWENQRDVGAFFTLGAEQPAP